MADGKVCVSFRLVIKENIWKKSFPRGIFLSSAAARRMLSPGIQLQWYANSIAPAPSLYLGTPQSYKSQMLARS